MAIMEGQPRDFVSTYTRPKGGSKEDDLAWLASCKSKARHQLYEYAIAPGCTVGTTEATTLEEGEQATPRLVGGGANLSRLVRAGAVLQISERQAATNRGEYEFVIGDRAVAGCGKIWEPHQGFNAPELDMPEESFRRSLNEPLIVLREATDGRDTAEQWVAAGLAERIRQRDTLLDKAKQVKGEAKKAESGK